MAREFKSGDPCPFCKTGLEEKAVTEVFAYKGQEMEYPNYVIFECNKCGESFVGDKTMKESARKLRDFYRQVDGFLTSSDIKRIRLKLERTQDQLSKMLGGGGKSFARYENCEVIQSEPMDNLLRILDRYPHALEVLEKKHEPHRVLSTTMVYHSKLEEGKLKVNYGK